MLSKYATLDGKKWPWKEKFKYPMASKRRANSADFPDLSINNVIKKIKRRIINKKKRCAQ